MDSKKSSILVVEDDSDLRETINEILADEYTVYAAGDGQEALDIIAKTMPDLVVSDIGMPRMSGFEMLEVVRTRRETESLPVIMLSARGDRDSIRRCMELGADDYIPKPFRADEVLNAVRSRISRQAVLRRPINELQETLALSLPHEFRTPLNGILGFAGLIEDQAADAAPVDKSELAEFAHQISVSGERLLHLVEKFTFHARLLTEIQSNPRAHEGRSEPGWNSAVIEQAEILARRYGRTADLAISVAAAPVAIPAPYLTHILGELLDNAFKYSDQGSGITVRGRPEGNDYLLVVADKGRGMSRDQVANIGPYVQFERKTHEQQGLGLGLATVSQIVELFNGQLDIESAPGAGTTVRVLLRLGEGDEA